MTATATEPQSNVGVGAAAEWIDSKTAATILGRSVEVVVRLGRRGVIREHRLPGTRPRYSKVDVLRLAPPAA